VVARRVRRATIRHRLGKVISELPGLRAAAEGSVERRVFSLVVAAEGQRIFASQFKCVRLPRAVARRRFPRTRVGWRTVTRTRTTTWASTWAG
jgi:hypothetical protein